jgi:hypothetical protein
MAGVLTHLTRIWKMDTAMGKAEYSIKLGLAGLTIGMFVLGLKDIKNGNDPTTRDYSDPKNYAEAIMVSGVAGPLGDMLLKEGKYGESMFDLVALGSSPALSLLSKPRKAIDNFVDEDKSFSEALGDSMRTTGQLIPGRNLLPTQWLTDEIGRDMLLLVNPDYQSKFDKIDSAKRARDSKSGLEEMPDFF